MVNPDVAVASLWRANIQSRLEESFANTLMSSLTPAVSEMWFLIMLEDCITLLVLVALGPL